MRLEVATLGTVEKADDSSSPTEVSNTDSGRFQPPCWKPLRERNKGPASRSITSHQLAPL